MNSIGFDNEKYLSLQSEKILERINSFGGKLYMEFGGKLFDDFHASRVLPGFKPDSKVRMLLKLKEQTEIIFAINASAIEQNKMRSDIGITYDMDILRLIDKLTEIGLYVGSVVITQYCSQPSANKFKTRLENLGIKVYLHYPIAGYPSNPQFIVSEEGFGKNDYIETSRSLVVVTAPGPGSGKMATCLSQLYHENKRGIKAGYAKYETFPVWSIPLMHPVNLAYEAATADLNDVNMIDPWHLQAYGQTTVNYNRDVEVFPVLNAIFEHISGSSPYKSPTDMGVNMVGFAIVDDDVVSESSKQEIIRRYYAALQKQKQTGNASDEVKKIEMLLNRLSLTKDDRRVAKAVNDFSEKYNNPVAGIELNDGTIVTGKTSELLGAVCSMLLNAIKVLAGIDDSVLLISKEVIEAIQKLKIGVMKNQNPRMHVDEVLIALSVSAQNDENAKKALEQVINLKGCQVHSSVILSQEDMDIFRRLGIDLTCEPQYESDKLYHR
ncbi:MAG: DUF1846 domain-containing protein [Clostridia bacterium]|nr:DUF1846 domain-containing protein [Clostridia bacterium]MBQ2349102.1 DUF1846 domain-containing protein [Clostridia bacterium]